MPSVAAQSTKPLLRVHSRPTNRNEFGNAGMSGNNALNEADLGRTVRFFSKKTPCVKLG
jgi:hypothetical protein